MIATEYQPLARRTMKELPREDHFVHMALGLCGEMGEFIDAVKKHVIYGKPLDLVNLTEETGDDFWYAAGLLPELGVSPMVLQRAIDEGHAQGTKRRQEKTYSTMESARDLLSLNFVIASISSVLANDTSKLAEGSSDAVKVVEGLGGVLGTLCGVFELDPALAMDLNIKKLAKRYGDKYSDVAALNRDLEGERAVLEQKPEHPLDEIIGAITFDQLVEHGRAEGVPLYGEKNMPWSFSIRGVAVTHENDECYIICGQGAKPYTEDNGHFTPGDKLYIVNGVWRIERPSVDLNSDTPLAGGSCSTDGPCESCQ